MSNANDSKGKTGSDITTNSADIGLLVKPRSWLFVPATRPERFTKAMNSGADAVIIDLEDAVAIEDKAAARQHIDQFVTQHVAHEADNNTEKLQQPSLWLRFNNNQHLNDDVQLGLSLKQKQGIAGVVLPKVTDASQVENLYQALQLPIVIQIESAQGIANLESIAKSKGLMAVSFGRLDISNELNLSNGSQAEQDFFNQLRIKMLLASSINGLDAPIESVYTDFKNEYGMQATANYASDLGFSGMLCIHPSQVVIANSAFKPSDRQLAFATQVTEHYQRTGDRVFAINGVMVDLPLILQCQKLLQ